MSAHFDRDTELGIVQSKSGLGVGDAAVHRRSGPRAAAPRGSSAADRAWRPGAGAGYGCRRRPAGAGTSRCSAPPAATSCYATDADLKTALRPMVKPAEGPGMIEPIVRRRRVKGRMTRLASHPTTIPPRTYGAGRKVATPSAILLRMSFLELERQRRVLETAQLQAAASRCRSGSSRSTARRRCCARPSTAWWNRPWPPPAASRRRSARRSRAAASPSGTRARRVRCRAAVPRRAGGSLAAPPPGQARRCMTMNQIPQTTTATPRASTVKPSPMGAAGERSCAAWRRTCSAPATRRLVKITSDTTGWQVEVEVFAPNPELTVNMRGTPSPSWSAATTAWCSTLTCS